MVTGEFLPGAASVRSVHTKGRVAPAFRVGQCPGLQGEEPNSLPHARSARHSGRRRGFPLARAGHIGQQQPPGGGVPQQHPLASVAFNAVTNREPRSFPTRLYTVQFAARSSAEPPAITSSSRRPWPRRSPAIRAGAGTEDTSTSPAYRRAFPRRAARHRGRSSDSGGPARWMTAFACEQGADSCRPMA